MKVHLEPFHTLIAQICTILSGVSGLSLLLATQTKAFHSITPAHADYIIGWLIIVGTVSGFIAGYGPSPGLPKAVHDFLENLKSNPKLN